MPRLEMLRADHADAVLTFERENRAYFAAAISDRGDAYFEQFPARHLEALAAQDAGDCAFFVLVDADGQVVGRFNLYDIDDGGARVGYRLAQHRTGRGLATAAVRELADIASRRGLRTLTAATSSDNVASQKVLIGAGFSPAGPADPAEVGGKHGVRYQRDLEARRP